MCVKNGCRSCRSMHPVSPTCSLAPRWALQCSGYTTGVHAQLLSCVIFLFIHVVYAWIFWDTMIKSVPQLHFCHLQHRKWTFTFWAWILHLDCKRTMMKAHLVRTVLMDWVEILRSSINVMIKNIKYSFPDCHNRSCECHLTLPVLIAVSYCAAY